MDLLQLIAMQQQGQQQMLGQMQDRPMLKPRAGIPVNRGTQTEWKIRGADGYTPYNPMSDRPYGAVNSTGQRVGSWRDDKSGPIGKTGPDGYQAYGPNGAPPVASVPASPAQASAAPTAKPSGGRGFADWFKGLFDDGDPATPSPAQAAGPRVNHQTDLPFGTMPGDQAYQDKLTQGAPKAIPVQEPGMAQQPPRDPQIQNLVDLANTRNAFMADNPMMQSVQEAQFGMANAPMDGGQGFNPGPVPNIPFGGQQSYMPNVAEPQQNNAYSGSGGVTDLGQPGNAAGYGPTVRPGMQVANIAAAANVPGALGRAAFAGTEKIAGNAAQVLNKAKTATQVAGDLAQGIRGAYNNATYAANAAGSPTFNAALKAEQAAQGAATSSWNVANRTGQVAKVLGGGSKLAPVVQGAAKFAAPAQAALMALEAGRLVGDQDYREQATADYETLADQGAGSRVMQAMGAPIATIGNTVMDLASLLGTSMSNGIDSIEARKGDEKLRKLKAARQNKQRSSK
jgi:hypothetical protein